MPRARNVQIPACMPLILSIIDDLGKGRSLSLVYLALWCQKSSRDSVSLSDNKQMAFNAGMVGQRSERTWRSYLHKLAELGFVKIYETNIVIIEPKEALKSLSANGAIGLNASKYRCVVDRDDPRYDLE